MSIPTTEENEDLPYDYSLDYSVGEEEEEIGRYGEEDVMRTEDFISRPYFSENCDIDENVLEFDFSYGYDCKKPYNLVCLDDKTIIFASGNLIHFFDVETRDVWFRRSAMGGGIGHIAKNPNPAYPHVAIGENGKKPPIIIYEWPSLEIIAVLKNGTSKIYTHLNYSPKGDLLVSQGGEPEYLITIWNWPTSTILLRTKSYVNDVLRVMFSPEVPGQLTSCGIAHIKFWKMASTFTGLKLKGELGRFGKTEFSDIVGIYPMADEKVISGCYWGNILVWDEGLIKLEVCRKGRKRCHDGPIVQFDYKNGELWTVSMDGRVRMWYYDTIDQADPPDDDRFVQMEPTYEFHTPGAEFMCIEKQFADPLDTFFFAQDGRGGIWRIDLTTETEATPSERLLKSHAGVATSLAICPWGPFFNTLGIGGRLHLYNYLTRKLLVIYLFPAKGLCLIWVPMDVEPSGEVIIAACDDGAIRVAVWKIDIARQTESVLNIIQITKPHTGYINIIKLNKTGNLFVSGGEDATIFVYQVYTKPGEYLKLIPIGYVNTPDPVTSLTWHNQIDTTIIVGCNHGQIMIVDLPTEPVDYTLITYVLHVEPIYQHFTTYKSQIKRDILLREIAAKKAAKVEKKREELERWKKENPGMELDEEVFLADSESEEKFDPLYVPPVPNKILWIQHTQDDTLWVSMAGYDAGYIYEYKIGQKEETPYHFTPVYEAEDVQINNFCYSKNKEFLIFGMQEGSIRVNRVNHKNWRDLSNYWELTMHNNFNGFIPGLAFSYDHTYFITCGHDGNVFTFRFFPETSISEDSAPIQKIIPENLQPIEEKSYYGILSLEETVVKAEQDRINKVANDNKNAYLVELQELTEKFEHLVELNSKLPPSQRIPANELEIDPRITKHLDEKLSADLALVKRKLAFDVEKSEIRMRKMKEHFIDPLDTFPLTVTGVKNPDLSIMAFKQARLDEKFYEMLANVDNKILESETKGRHRERLNVGVKQSIVPLVIDTKLEYFLLGLPQEVLEKKLDAKFVRLLDRYRARKKAREIRAHEWLVFKSTQPIETLTDEEDTQIILKAEEDIGDFKLKSSKNYKVPKHLRETTSKKFKELLLVCRQQFDIAHEINVATLNLREKKKNLHEFLIAQKEILDAIHEEMEIKEDELVSPAIFKFGDFKDYPERQYEINVDMPGEEAEAEKENKIVPRNLDSIQREVLYKMSSVEPEEREEPTSWEIEAARERRTKLLFYQRETIEKMEVAMTAFDDSLESFREKRINVILQFTLMLLHLITLNQELMILKECESKEDALSEVVQARTINLMDIQDVILNLNNQIQQCKKEIERSQEKEKEIQKQFFNATSENKFYDFLRKIFKKKYRPPKIPTDDESDSDSSSSSSDESEDEDAGSIDSKDFGIVRLDENVCPKGCDQNIYDFTFQLRSQRHGVESEIKDQNNKMDMFKKEVEMQTKRMKVAQAAMNAAREELDVFQRGKQQRLNQIFCTVVLKLQQLQHIQENGKMNMIKDSLVMNKKALGNLYRRVEQLNAETIQQMSKHQLSVSHLNRMKADIQYMTKEISGLKAKIKEEMKIKFGGPVNIHDLDEFLLKKMVFNLKLSLLDIENIFKEELKFWKQMLTHKQKELFSTFRKNTTRLELLALLKTEKNNLTKMFDTQHKLKMKMEDMIDQAEAIRLEVKKLEKVVHNQQKEMEEMRREIKIFKTKGYVIKPEIKAPEEPSVEEEEEGSFVSEWEYLDDYKFSETYAKEYWASIEKKEKSDYKKETIKVVMGDLFQNLNIELNRLDIVNMLQTVISDVMKKCDIEEIISDLLANIPGTLNDQQQSLIELTAEKLCSIEKFENDVADVEAIIADIIADVTIEESQWE